MNTRPKFFPLLKHAIDTYQDKWRSFFALAFVTVGLGTLLQIGILKLVNYYFVRDIIAEQDAAATIKVPFNIAMEAGITGGIIGSIAAGFLGLVLIAGIIHLIKSKKALFLDSIIFGLKNLGKFILMALHILWYTLGWLLLLITGFLMTDFLTHFSKYGLTAVIGKEIEVDPMRETVSNVIREMTTGFHGKLSLFLVILGAVIAVIMFVRSIKVTFSYYALLEEGSMKKALKKSIAAVKGNFWLVLFYMLIIGFMASIIMSVIGSAATKLATGTILANYAENVIVTIFTIIFMPIIISFEYRLYEALKK